MKTQTSATFREPVSAGVQLVTVDPEREGQRIDNFLATRLKGVPRSLIYRIFFKSKRRQAPNLGLAIGAYRVCG